MPAPSHKVDLRSYVTMIFLKLIVTS